MFYTLFPNSNATVIIQERRLGLSQTNKPPCLGLWVQSLYPIRLSLLRLVPVVLTKGQTVVKQYISFIKNVLSLNKSIWSHYGLAIKTVFLFSVSMIVVM